MVKNTQYITLVICFQTFNKLVLTQHDTKRGITLTLSVELSKALLWIFNTNEYILITHGNEIIYP